MKQLIARVFDALMPPGARDLRQAEELGRAQTLIFLQLLIFSCALVGLIGSVIITQVSPTLLDGRAPLVLIGSVCGYALSALVFRQTGNNIASTNVLALTFYATIILLLLPVSGQELIGSMLYMLALPFLVTLTANYQSAIFWVVMVALSPVLLNILGKGDIGWFFIANWDALSLGLFFAIYSSHNFLNNLSQRLHVERNWLEFVAGHDSMTGVANRATFDRRLLDSITLCKLHGTQSVLVFIDLDKFKPINDVHGHQAGDAVLTEVADRLKRLVRRSDTVARLGGDEFAILFDQCSPEGVKPVIDRITTVVSAPIDASGTQLHVGCSLGVVVCPNDGTDPKQLARTADERMYEAKRKTSSGQVAMDPAAQRARG
jgi:diguanylate cyclase (GGDEF)-like protein